jgi:hypothetical protein
VKRLPECELRHTQEESIQFDCGFLPGDADRATRRESLHRTERTREQDVPEVIKLHKTKQINQSVQQSQHLPRQRSLCHFGLSIENAAQNEREMEIDTIISIDLEKWLIRNK